MTIQQAIEVYINERQKDLRPNSLRNYQQSLNRMADFLGPERTMAAITSEEVTRFQLSLREQGMSTNTELNYANLLRPFFKFWKEEGITSVNWVRIKGPRKDEVIPNCIRQDQFELIDEFLEENEYYQLIQKVVFNLLWDTGMRINELLSIDIQDLDLEKRSVVIQTMKLRKRRYVFWSEPTNQLLRRYLGVRLCMNTSAELFQAPGKNGNPTRLTARTVQRWCKKLGVELGFRINPHAFRHGKMHQILVLGGRREDIQTVAGHSSIVSSEVYLRLNEQEQQRIHEPFLKRRDVAQRSKKKDRIGQISPYRLA